MNKKFRIFYVIVAVIIIVAEISLLIFDETASVLGSALVIVSMVLLIISLFYPRKQS